MNIVIWKLVFYKLGYDMTSGDTEDVNFNADNLWITNMAPLKDLKRKEGKET
jgi:hypothetical protein